MARAKELFLITPQRCPSPPAASEVRNQNFICCCLERLLQMDTAKDGLPTSARPFRIILPYAHTIFFYTSWMESHNMGLIAPIWRHKTIGFYPVLIYSLRPTQRFTSSAAESKMGPWSCYCKAADHIRAIKQYIKTASLWSYHTCHWSISSYICQAVRILIAQLITASDWCDCWIYSSRKCRDTVDKCVTGLLTIMWD